MAAPPGREEGEIRGDTGTKSASSGATVGMMLGGEDSSGSRTNTGEMSTDCLHGSSSKDLSIVLPQCQLSSEQPSSVLRGMSPPQFLTNSLETDRSASEFSLKRLSDRLSGRLPTTSVTDDHAGRSQHRSLRSVLGSGCITNAPTEGDVSRLTSGVHLASSAADGQPGKRSLHRQTSWGAPLGGPSRAEKQLHAERGANQYNSPRGKPRSIPTTKSQQCWGHGSDEKEKNSVIPPSDDPHISGVTSANAYAMQRRCLPIMKQAIPGTLTKLTSTLSAVAESKTSTDATLSLNEPSEVLTTNPNGNFSVRASAAAAAAAQAATNATGIALASTDDSITARLQFEDAIKAECFICDETYMQIRDALSRVIRMDSSAICLEQALKCLDCIMSQTADRINELLHSMASPVLKPPGIDLLFASRNFQTLAEPLSAGSSFANFDERLSVAVTPDFGHLVKENLAFGHIALAALEPVSIAQWSPRQELTKIVTPTGFANALYRKPQESPLWIANQSQQSLVVSAVCEVARKQARELHSFWSDQADDYDGAETRWQDNTHAKARLPFPNAHGRHPGTKSAGRSECVSTASKPAMAGSEGTSRASLLSLASSRSSRVSATSRYAPTPIEGDETGGSGAPTRARKALRDETTEHERLVSELLASSAKEARVERGAVNEEDLPIPLPVAFLAREDPRLQESRLACRLIPDPCAEQAQSANNNLWSDLEKCIFLDKFLQYPKNFGKISAFFTRKRARDCVQLYYDSKYCIDYKALLREHQQRRRGVRICWDITARAVHEFGGELTHDHRRNIVWFRLPSNTFSTTTANKHPPRGRRIGFVTNEIHTVPAISPSDGSSILKKSFGKKQRSGTASCRGPKEPILPATKRRLTQSKPSHAKMRLPAAKSVKVSNTNSSIATADAPHVVIHRAKTEASPSSMKKRVIEPGSVTSEVSQKRLKAHKTQQCSQQIHRSQHYIAVPHNAEPLAPANVHAPTSAATPIFAHQQHEGNGTFSRHDRFSSHPLSISPVLSTSTGSVGCPTQIPTISTLTHQSDLQQHHRQVCDRQLMRMPIRGNPAPLLVGISGYGLSNSAPLSDDHQRLAYDLHQAAPILPAFSSCLAPSGHHDDSKHFGHLPPSSCFYSDSAQQAANAAYAAALGSTSISQTGKDSQPQAPALLASSLQRSDTNDLNPPDSLVQLHTEYGQPSRIAVGTKGFCLAPPVVCSSEALHVSSAMNHAGAPIASNGQISIDQATECEMRVRLETAQFPSAPACSPLNVPVATSSLSSPTMENRVDGDELSGGTVTERRPPQKWTASEKALFLRHFVTHGKNWSALTLLIPTKTEAQIKNYYQNYKNRLGLQEILSLRHTSSEQTTVSATSHDIAMTTMTNQSACSPNWARHPNLSYADQRLKGANMTIASSAIQQNRDDIAAISAITSGASDGQTGEYARMHVPRTLQSTINLHGFLGGGTSTAATDTVAHYHRAAPLESSHVGHPDNPGPKQYNHTWNSNFNPGQMPGRTGQCELPIWPLITSEALRTRDQEKRSSFSSSIHLQHAAEAMLKSSAHTTCGVARTSAQSADATAAYLTPQHAQLSGTPQEWIQQSQGLGLAHTHHSSWQTLQRPPTDLRLCPVSTDDHCSAGANYNTPDASDSV